MMWRWQHFTFSEVFRSKTVATTEVTPHVLSHIEDVLDRLTLLRREIKDSPITINSFFRDKAHNKLVGGVPNSYHTQGMAADIKSSKLSLTELAIAAKKYFNCVIIYPTFIHVDTALRAGKPCFQDKRK